MVGHGYALARIKSPPSRAGQINFCPGMQVPIAVGFQ